MKSFQFTTTVETLNKSKSLDFRDDLDSGRIELKDTVRVYYDKKSDTLRGTVIANGAAFGDIFDPASYKADPSFVQEMMDISNSK